MSADDGPKLLLNIALVVSAGIADLIVFILGFLWDHRFDVAILCIVVLLFQIAYATGVSGDASSCPQTTGRCLSLVPSNI